MRKPPTLDRRHAVDGLTGPARGSTGPGGNGPAGGSTGRDGCFDPAG